LAELEVLKYLPSFPYWKHSIPQSSKMMEIKLGIN